MDFFVPENKIPLKELLAEESAMRFIESRNNPTIKNMTALRDRREREKTRLFYFEGVHLLEEYLRAGKRPYSVFVREDVTERYGEIIEKADCEVYKVTSSVYDKLSEEKAPQGIFTVSEFLDNVCFVGNGIGYDEFAGRINDNAIALVDLRDNGNVGTVIRTAAALDCDILLCGSCADIFASKTVRATMGAVFTNDIYVCDDTLSAIKSLQRGGKRVIASALDEKASVLGRFEIGKNDCFLIGNEGQGLPCDIINACDMTCIIPMSGRTESLNAASAASMLLWEAKRGRMK